MYLERYTEEYLSVLPGNPLPCSLHKEHFLSSVPASDSPAGPGAQARCTRACRRACARAWWPSCRRCTRPRTWRAPSAPQAAPGSSTCATYCAGASWWRAPPSRQPRQQGEQLPCWLPQRLHVVGALMQGAPTSSMGCSSRLSVAGRFAVSPAPALASLSPRTAHMQAAFAIVCELPVVALCTMHLLQRRCTCHHAGKAGPLIV